MSTFNVTNGHPVVEWDYDLAKNPNVDRIEVGIFTDQKLSQLVSSSRVGSSYKACSMAMADGFYFVSCRALISATGEYSDWGEAQAMIVSNTANPVPNPVPDPPPVGKPDTPTNIRIRQ